MENSYYNTAYIIAGKMKNGRIVYYGYDLDICMWGWFSSALEDANLFETIENAETFLHHAEEEINPDTGFITSIWIEKLTTFPVPNTQIDII